MTAPWRWRPRRRSPARPRSTVQLDGTASTGRGLAYAWDLDGDGQFDDATGARPSATFAAGTYSVRLQVTDASGVAAVSPPLTVTVDAPPAPPDVPSSAPSTAAPAPRVRARLVHRHRPVMARRDGTVVLRGHCPSHAACAGSIVVRASSAGPALGRARFTVPARSTITVRLRLSATGRRMLARHTRLRAISIAALEPAAGPLWRTDTVFTLRVAQRAAGAPEGRPPPCMTPSLGATSRVIVTGLVSPSSVAVRVQRAQRDAVAARVQPLAVDAQVPAQVQVPCVVAERHAPDALEVPCFRRAATRMPTRCGWRSWAMMLGVWWLTWIWSRQPAKITQFGPSIGGLREQPLRDPAVVNV